MAAGLTTVDAGAGTNTAIVRSFMERTPRSAGLAANAHALLPSGLSHDSRRIDPYPVYIDRAEGARKWDVDDNEYIDFIGGHGALLLGHNHPEVVAAMRAQLARGTHYGAEHELALRWAAQIRQLMPVAERIRFTSSGTEATLLALRLARAFTDRPKVVRFAGHFHGWHDHVSFGFASHFDGTPTPGVLPEIAANTVLLPAGDLGALRDTLQRHADIGAVILEPTGASWGRVPMRLDFLEALREETAERDIVLIFDEVVTGFRVAPGGAQEAYGIRPDLAVLGKIVAGGQPGAAVVGAKPILDLLDFDAAVKSNREKIGHQGTFNASLMSAAAGLATLEIVAATDACRRASDMATRLRDGWNDVLVEQGVPWAAYGTFSMVHLFTNPKRRAVAPHAFDAGAVDALELKGSAPELVGKLRLAMLVNGVDISGWPGALVSAAHSPDDIDASIAALRDSIGLLRQDGELAA